MRGRSPRLLGDCRWALPTFGAWYSAGSGRPMVHYGQAVNARAAKAGNLQASSEHRGVQAFTLDRGFAGDDPKAFLNGRCHVNRDGSGVGAIGLAARP